MNMKKPTSTLLCAIGWLFLATLAAGQPWPFSRQAVHPNVPGADEVACGDIDGDGRVDILCAQSEGPQLPIRWHRNLGGDPPRWMQSDRVTPVHKDWNGEPGWMGSWLGDFDGDGDRDVVSGAKGSFSNVSRPLCWYENARGDGSAWVERVLPVNGDYIDNCRAADFDGDGRDDIVAQKYHGGGVYLVRCPAPADARRSDGWTCHKIGEGGSGLCLADIDGDRRVDVLVDNQWLKNPGHSSGENWLAFRIADAPGGVKNAAGDLNGDGRTDVVLASEEGRGIWWFEAPAEPTKAKWIRHTLREDCDGNHSLWLADFNRDGRLDILTAEMHTRGKHRVAIFENAAADAAKWIEHVIATSGSHNALAADVNADGRPDIVGCNFAETQNPLEVWYNELPPRSQ